MDFTVQTSITAERLNDLLTCAFEGGSGYWVSISGVVDPSSWEAKFDNSPEDRPYPQDYPFNPGGAVILCDDEEDKSYRLDTAALQRGLDTMAKDHPQHLADFLAENEDAETGDVFLQCCIFGEVVYG
jgi:hypothetical protein